MTSQGGSAISSTVETVGSYANEVSHRLRDHYGQFSEQAQEGYQSARDVVIRNPMQWLAVAFGVGVLTGMFMGSSFSSSYVAPAVLLRAAIRATAFRGQVILSPLIRSPAESTNGCIFVRNAVALALICGGLHRSAGDIEIPLLADIEQTLSVELVALSSTLLRRGERRPFRSLSTTPFREEESCYAWPFCSRSSP